MKKLLGSTLTAASLATVALLGATAPASAAGAVPVPAAAAACESGQVCLYDHGTEVYRGAPAFPGQCFYFRHVFDYVQNNSGIKERAWSGTNCTGRNVLLNPNTGSGVNLFWSLGGE